MTGIKRSDFVSKPTVWIEGEQAILVDVPCSPHPYYRVYRRGRTVSSATGSFEQMKCVFEAMHDPLFDPDHYDHAWVEKVYGKPHGHAETISEFAARWNTKPMLPKPYADMKAHLTRWRDPLDIEDDPLAF